MVASWKTTGGGQAYPSGCNLGSDSCCASGIVGTITGGQGSGKGNRP